MPLQGKVVQSRTSNYHPKIGLKKRKNDLAETLFTSEKQFRLLVENSSDAIAIILKDRSIAYMSSSVMHITGYSPEELTGKDGLTFFHPEDLLVVKKAFATIIKKERSRTTFQARVKSKKGQWIWIESTMTNFFSVPSIHGIVANFHNVTSKKQIQERQRILDSISIVLMASFDDELILQNVIKFFVPNFTDYCRIVTVDNEKNINEVTTYYFDKEKNPVIKKIFNENIYKNNMSYGIYKILDSGEAEFIPDIAIDSRLSISENPEIQNIIRQFQLKSYIGVPLIARGKVVGAMTFSSSQEGRYYTIQDLQFAQEVGRRIALSIDNASLYKSAQNEIKERKRLEKQKDDFVAIASHELKTPLTSIKAYAQVLEKRFEKEGNEASARLVSKMDMQLDKLTNLIKDLLDISKIESGRLIFQENLFMIGDLLDEIIEEMQRTTDMHVIVREGNTNGVINGDKERIGQVLTNLLSNAIKYAPNTEKIYVSLKRKKKGIEICVKDFGIGISKENLSHIFERFFRVRDPQLDTYPGLGLGLYISKEIIERQGGTISVTSGLKKGSTFCIWLPFATKSNLGI